MLKRTLPLFVVLLLPPAVVQGAADAPAETDRPLGGAFQTLRITDPRAGKFFCPACESGLHAGVIVFIRDIAKPGAADADKPEAPMGEKPLNKLLKGINDKAAAYSLAELGTYAVLLNDGGYREALENKTDSLDDAMTSRDDQAKKLTALAKDAEAKNVVLSLGMIPEDQKAYGIPAAADVTILVFFKHQVVGLYPYTNAKLTSAEVDNILAVVDRTAKEADRLAQLKKK